MAACANEASEEVLVLLAEQFPESKTSVDKRRRTPLHFALGHTERPANVATVVLLSGTGAALMPDENGMLVSAMLAVNFPPFLIQDAWLISVTCVKYQQPLHYACAYGATEQALRVLTDDNIQTITATDNRGRTPLHFALGNADRPASPGVVGLLLSQNPGVVNSIDLEGNLPIHLLATRAQAINEDESDKCANCQACFSLYLNAQPSPTADLLTALQSLPEWLRDYAVLSQVVQKILNMKISQRFPTAVTVLDFFFYIMVITFFQLAVIDSLEDRYNGTNNLNKGYLVPLYLAVVYFTVREMIQARSLASLGLFNTWVADFENWLDVIYILLILFWSIVMTVQGLPTVVFQNGSALSMALFWTMILSFLQSILVGFAVFVGGVIYVVKRLTAFLVALFIILVAFAQIFYTLFRMTDECNLGNSKDYYIDFPIYSVDPTVCEINATTEALGADDLQCIQDNTSVDCEPAIETPFCNFGISFFKVFTMLLGEVDESLFAGNDLA